MESEKAQKKKRRKWPWIVGGLLLLFFIIGISSGGGKSNNGGDSGSSKNQDTTYSINQEVQSSDVIWKVTNARDRGNTLRANESRYPTIATNKTTNGRYIEVSVVVENRSNDLASITTPKLVDGQGREYTDITFSVSEWIPEGKDIFLLQNLNPNIPRDFVVMFEVPADATGLQLKVGVLRPQKIDLGL